MSEDTKPKQRNGSDPIPVRVLKFAQSTDIPGKAGASSCMHIPQAQHRRYEIAYMPWLRHHRITYISGAEAQEPEVVFVYEGHVATWAPL